MCVTVCTNAFLYQQFLTFFLFIIIIYLFILEKKNYEMNESWFPLIFIFSGWGMLLLHPFRRVSFYVFIFYLFFLFIFFYFCAKLKSIEACRKSLENSSHDRRRRRRRHSNLHMKWRDDVTGKEAWRHDVIGPAPPSLSVLNYSKKRVVGNAPVGRQLFHRRPFL